MDAQKSSQASLSGGICASWAGTRSQIVKWDCLPDPRVHVFTSWQFWKKCVPHVMLGFLLLYHWIYHITSRSQFSLIHLMSIIQKTSMLYYIHMSSSYMLYQMFLNISTPEDGQQSLGISSRRHATPKKSHIATLNDLWNSWDLKLQINKNDPI